MKKSVLLILISTLILESCQIYTQVDYVEKKENTSNYEIQTKTEPDQFTITINTPFRPDSINRNRIISIESVRILTINKKDTISYEGQSSGNQYVKDFYFYDKNLLNKLYRDKKVITKIIYKVNDKREETIHILRKRTKRLPIIGRMLGC